MSGTEITGLELLAALVSGRVDAREVITRPEPGQRSLLIRQAVQHKLGPQLYHVLRQAGVFEQLDPQSQAALSTTYYQAASANQLALEAVLTWTELFAGAAIDAVWLKGVPLCLTVYADPALRPFSDIDVIVPANQLSQALQLVKEQTGVAPALMSMSEDKHASLRTGPHQQVLMELHWSLIGGPSSTLAPDVAWFLSQRDTIPFRNTNIQALLPEAHLLYLCAHAQLGHGEAQSPMLRYFDMSLLLQHYEQFDWQLFVNQAIRFNWAYAVARALQIVVRLFDVPVPTELFSTLESGRSLNDNATFPDRRSVVQNRWESVYTYSLTLNWRARIRFLYRVIFPPRSYMAWRYNVNRQWQVPFYYPYRWSRGAQEAIRAIAKHLRA